MALGAELIGQLDFLGDWGVLTTDQRLVVTGWNRWLTQRTGLTPGAVLGKTLPDLFPDLPARRIDQYYRQALAGRPVVLSQRLHRYVLPMRPAHAGTGFDFMQQTARIIPVANGPDAGGTVTLIEDVTERVVYEAELRARARRQAATAVVARAALAGGELEDVAREVVRHVRDTLDVEFAEVVEARPEAGWIVLAGGGWYRPAPVVFDPSAPRLQADLAAGSLVITTDLGDDHLRANGVGGGVIVAVPGPAGRPPRRLGVYARGPRAFPQDEVEFVRSLADVLGMAGERKHLEDELRLRLGDLAEVDKRKDDFLATLAHELRNPLAPVRNSLQILRLTPDPEIRDRALGVMGRQLGHMVRLIDDLLDLSRINRNKMELRRAPIRLPDVVASAVETARPAIDAAGHELTVTLPPTPVTLDADLTRLAQVFANLLTNSAKYTEPGGRIGLEAVVDPGGVTVTVRDTGIGIPAAALPTLFEMFAQVDRAAERAAGGLGIGLALVKGLVDMHGGTVAAASPGPGQGSTFTVRLPVVDSPPPAAEGQPGLAGRSASPRRILVVDDNRDSAATMGEMLRLGGHDVALAHDGVEALDRAEAFRPEVILMDVGMPRMNGLDAARQIRSRPWGTDAVIVAMTGWGQAGDRVRTKEAGFDAHLVKPVDALELQDWLLRLHRPGE